MRNGMNRKRNAAAVVTWLAITLLEGCASLGYLPGQQTIGRLRLIGPNVFVNGKPARDGQLVNGGDRLHTGVDSSAYMYFLSGGFLQFDQATDPVIEIVWRGTSCEVQVDGMRQGQAYEESNPQCRTVVNTPHGAATHDGSVFNIKVDRQQTVLTALDGKMILLRPKPVELQKGQQLSVSPAGIGPIRILSEQELREVTRWRDRFPAPCASDGSSCSAPGGAPPAGQCCD